MTEDSEKISRILEAIIQAQEVLGSVSLQTIERLTGIDRKTIIKYLKEKNIKYED